jgi:hypothetical protein
VPQTAASEAGLLLVNAAACDTIASGGVAASTSRSGLPGVVKDQATMLDFYSEFLWLFLILVAAYYLGAPMVIRFQQRYPAHPELTALDFENLDPSLAKFLMSRTKALFALGFDEPTLIQIPDPAPGVTAYLIMVINRQTGDKAMVTALVGHGPPEMRVLYLEFSTRFETGELFDTLNSAELNAFPPGPMTVRTQVPQVDDPETLYELHTYVMSKHDVRSKKVLYEPNEALDYLTRYAFVKTYDEQVARGWLYYDEAQDVYGLTMKGAYLISWGLMQPFKALRNAALRSKARSVLQEFYQARPSPG